MSITARPISPSKLLEACPQGIDIYYENVGGKVFDEVLPLLNTSARVPVCGLVSGYNATALPTARIACRC
ncbi:oxidoreductase YncB [Klebsiella grimontii]|uniref:Oxidoreductase YncB n=1 Tax=Klebsiella grimontii TaxID=2058152 RepID=A0A7H4P4A8_9ENTR|nr:oxidoreductase YncB [Klebsiella grimontii]